MELFARFQIYHASFKDSSNDGLGEILEIISKSTSSKTLEIDIVSLSPNNESSQHDIGYGIFTPLRNNSWA